MLAVVTAAREMIEEPILEGTRREWTRRGEAAGPTVLPLVPVHP